MLSATSWDTTQARMAGLIHDLLGVRTGVDVPCTAGCRGMSAPVRDAAASGRRYDYLVVGAGFAGSVIAERLAQSARRARPVDRSAERTSAAMPMTSRTRPGSCITSTGRTSSTPTATGRRLSVAVHEVAAVRAPRPRHRARQDGADSDQPDDAERTVWAGPEDRRRSGGISRFARRAGGGDQDLRRRRNQCRGPELYELFFRGYTRKQWGLDPSELDK